MSASVARPSKTAGGQVDTYLEAAPKGTSRRVIESLIKQHSGDSAKIHEEINGLWDSQETRQQKQTNTQSSSEEWQNVTKRGRNTKDKVKSAAPPQGNRRGANPPRTGRQERDRTRTDRDRSDRRVARPAAAAASAAPVRAARAPVPAPVEAVAPQPQDDASNPAEKPETRPVPTSGNSWSGAASFAERIKASEQARKEAEALQKKQQEQARKQAPVQEQARKQAATAAATPKLPNALDEQQAKDQAFPVLQSKAGVARPAVEAGADENSNPATNVPMSWASKAMAPPKPKAPPAQVAPAKAESPEEKVVASPANATPDVESVTEKPKETVQAPPKAVKAKNESVQKPVGNNNKSASGNNKNARPVKSNKSNQSSRKSTKPASDAAASPAKQAPDATVVTPSSPDSYVKLPAHFNESEEFSFGGFALDSTKTAAAAVPQVGAWGTGSPVTNETKPAKQQQLDERQEAFVHGLMAGNTGTATSERSTTTQQAPAEGIREVKTPPGIEAPVAINATDFEAKALATADATIQSSSKQAVPAPAAAKQPVIEQTATEPAQPVAQQAAQPVQQHSTPVTQSQARPQQALQQQQHYQQQQYLQQPPVPQPQHTMGGHGMAPMHQQPQQRYNNNGGNNQNNKGRKNNRNNRGNNNKQQYSRMPPGHDVQQPAPGFPPMEAQYQQYSQQQQDNVYGYPQQGFNAMGGSDPSYGGASGYQQPGAAYHQHQPDNNFYGSTDPSLAPPPGMGLGDAQAGSQQPADATAGESTNNPGVMNHPQSNQGSFGNVQRNPSPQHQPPPQMPPPGQTAGGSATSGYGASSTPPLPQQQQQPPQYQGGGYAAPPGMTFNGYYPQSYNYGTYAAYPAHYSSGRSTYGHGGAPTVYDQRGGSGYGFEYDQAGYSYDQNYSGLGSASGNTSEQATESAHASVSSGHSSSQGQSHLQQQAQLMSGQQSGVGSGVSTQQQQQPHPASGYGQAPMYPAYGSQYQPPGQQNQNWVMPQQQQQQGGFNQQQQSQQQQGQYQQQQAPAGGYRGATGGNWTRG